jgi:hypothetical protein
MIDMYFRPSPTHGFTVYITEQSRKYKSLPIRRALYNRPPPRPIDVRPGDVAQHTDARKYKSSPIRRALYYRPPPTPTHADRMIRSGRRGSMSPRPTQMRVIRRWRRGRILHAFSEAEDLYVLAFLTTFY